MVFNSLGFAVFLAGFFLLYWFACRGSLKLQNLLVLAGSYAFYAWCDWRFLPWLAGSTLWVHFLALSMGRTSDLGRSRLLLGLGLLQGIGGLAYFKYASFLVPVHPILPLGISFYTFRTMGYLLDIHKGKIRPASDWVAFSAYVAFFPSLLSGPIDKPMTIIPQLQQARPFDYGLAADGLRQILWGWFKKAVIADNCASIADQMFNHHEALPSSSLWLGAFFYTIQVYADFSGYSDMAIGSAGMLGFRTAGNFDNPLFSRNIAEFWRKWHISLTAWMTDHVFTPLSILFRDLGKWGLALAILANFTLIGIWHGANWTYLCFGFLHGCFFIPLIMRGTIGGKKEAARGRFFPAWSESLDMAGTFTLVMLTFIIFRAENLSEALAYFRGLFSLSLFSMPVIEGRAHALATLLMVLLMLSMEWTNRGKPHALFRFAPQWPKAARWAVYYGMLAAIFILADSDQGFIYFKF